MVLGRATWNWGEAEGRGEARGRKEDDEPSRKTAMSFVDENCVRANSPESRQITRVALGRRWSS